MWMLDVGSKHLVYNMKFTIMQDLMPILYSCTCSLWYNTRKTKHIYKEFIDLNEFSHRKCGVFWFRKGYWITFQMCYHSRHGGSILWTSYTHKSPICMHLTIFDVEHDSIKKLSMNSNTLSSHHNLHAYQFRFRIKLYFIYAIHISLSNSNSRRKRLTYICKKCLGMFCKVKATILFHTNYVKQDYTKAEDIWLHREYSSHCIFWSHICVICIQTLLLLSLLKPKRRERYRKKWLTMFQQLFWCLLYSVFHKRSLPFQNPIFWQPCHGPTTHCFKSLWMILRRESSWRYSSPLAIPLIMLWQVFQSSNGRFFESKIQY